MNTQRQREGLRWKQKPIPELVRLAWPIAVSMLSFSIMTVVDTLFVGRLGASALSGVGLGGVAAFMVLCFGMGFLRASKVLISQAVGAGRSDKLEAYTGAIIWAALGMGALALGAGRLLAQYLPALAKSPATGELAAAYLGVRILGAPLSLLNTGLRELRYGLSDSRTPMQAMLLANAANVVLDALFIFGFGWGVEGAAAATVAAEALAVTWLFRRQLERGLHLAAASPNTLLALGRLGVPLGFEFVMSVGSFAALVAVLASIGETDLAAHQIVLQVSHLSFLPALALGEAASVMIGQAVGANEDGLVKRVAYRALGAAAIYNGLCGLGFALFARPIASAFTSDPAVLELAVKLMYIAAAFQLFDGAGAVARSALRGTGDVRYAAAIGVLVAWAITPPVALFLGKQLGMGAVGGWLGLCAEICLVAALFWWRLVRDQWRVAAERSRLELAQRADSESLGAPVTP